MRQRGRGDFAATAAAAGKGKAEQGAIAQAGQVVSAGDQQHLQLDPGNGRLLLRAFATLVRAAAGTGQQLAHLNAVDGIGQLLQLMDLAQHRYAVGKGSQSPGAGAMSSSLSMLSR